MHKKFLRTFLLFSTLACVMLEQADAMDDETGDDRTCTRRVRKCLKDSSAAKWVLNIGIFAWNKIAGDGFVCQFDCCEPAYPIRPCWNMMEVCSGPPEDAKLLGPYGNLPQGYKRNSATNNLCCLSLLCLPCDTAIHVALLPVRLWSSVCECFSPGCICICEDCCDSTPTYVRATPQQFQSGGRTYVPETHKYYTYKGQVESTWVDMSNPEERKKMYAGTHSSIIKN